LNKIAPITVFTRLFWNLSFSQDSNSIQKVSLTNFDVEATFEISSNLEDVFEFVSGRSLDFKIESKEVERRNENSSNHLMYKSKLVKRLYKKIAYLNESTC
jgi:hypothetical protein